MIRFAGIACRDSIRQLLRKNFSSFRFLMFILSFREGKKHSLISQVGGLGYVFIYVYKSMGFKLMISFI